MTTLTSSRRRCGRFVACLIAIAVAVLASEAWGQTSNGTQFRRGTTLGGFAGVAAGDTKAALGTALGWEISPRLAVEGRGLWLPDGTASTDFVASLNALMPIRPLGAVVPFASAGVGMYRATVDAGQRDVPEFYRQRLGVREHEIFQDFALTMGGGANMFVSPHFAIRPEVTILLVTTTSDVRTVALFGVHVVYHFVSHKVQ